MLRVLQNPSYRTSSVSPAAKGRAPLGPSGPTPARGVSRARPRRATRAAPAEQSEAPPPRRRRRASASPQDVRPRTVAAVDASGAVQPRERLFVSLRMVALATLARPRAECREARQVGNEAEPLEVVEDTAFELRARTFAVVVLDPQPHLAPRATREAPDVDRIEKVPEMEVAGRRRREASDQLQIADCRLRNYAESSRCSYDAAIGNRRPTPNALEVIRRPGAA